MPKIGQWRTARRWLQDQSKVVRQVMAHAEPSSLTPDKRLIVALDLPSHDAARSMVQTLDNVSFFKVGWQLVFAGDLFAFLKSIQDMRDGQGGVFIDLKIAGDIGHTIANIVRPAAKLGVRFMTLMEAAEPAITDHALSAGRAARDGLPYPEFLMVPLLSSLSGPIQGGDTDTYIARKGKNLLSRGCDGLVVSGTSIGACRQAMKDIPIVSPGIRPAWATVDGDDQVRTTTPTEAIHLGADYLVVGRPVIAHPNPRDAAERIIDEINEAQTGVIAPALSVAP